MTAACEFDRITSDIAIWHAYDPAVKAELSSTWLVTPDGTYFVDPIPLKNEALDKLVASSRIAGIIVTNSNHCRASARFAERLRIPTIAHADTFPDEQPGGLRRVADGDDICHGLRVIGIEGAGGGEIALHYAPDGGTFIIGDALINFEPHGFTLLPAKYCSNQKEMRRSLRKLLAYQAERMFFGHGTPILSGASERLRDLLDSESR